MFTVAWHGIKLLPQLLQGASILPKGAFSIRLGIGQLQFAKRLCSRKRERHVPEIDLRRAELHADVGFAITLALNRGHPAFHFARVIFVENDYHLADYKRMFGFDLRTVLAHGVALHVNTKFVPVLVLPMQREGNSQ